MGIANSTTTFVNDCQAIVSGAPPELFKRPVRIYRPAADTTQSADRASKARASPAVEYRHSDLCDTELVPRLGFTELGRSLGESSCGLGLISRYDAGFVPQGHQFRLRLT